MNVWTHGLSAADLWALFVHFTLLSLLAVGGAIATASDMQRYVVGERGWLSDAQFTASVALAQAAPGPNVLFVAVVGLNVGGVLGVVAALGGSLAPSCAVALTVGRTREKHREARFVRAFTAGLAPLTLGLLVATSWVLLAPTRHLPATAVLVAASVAWMVLTRRSPLWAMCLGAAVGAAGWLD